MRKAMLTLLLVPALLLGASIGGNLDSAYAAPAMHGGGGGGHFGGGGHVGGGRGFGGGGGHFGGGHVSHFGGGSRGHGFGGRGGHFGHGGHFRGGVWVGAPFFWDPFFYPYYPYYPYPYSAPSTTVVVPEQSDEYIVPEQQDSGYWYYCRESRGYYPYIKSCPGGWMKVVPTPAPDQEE
jgi:hypothetical protein